MILAAVFLAGLLLGVLLACLAWLLADSSSVRRPGYLPPYHRGYVPVTEVPPPTIAPPKPSDARRAAP